MSFYGISKLRPQLQSMGINAGPVPVYQRRSVIEFIDWNRRLDLAESENHYWQIMNDWAESIDQTRRIV